MLTWVDEKDEAEDVLRHMLTSSNMRLDVPRLQFLIFGLAGMSKPEGHVRTR